MVDSRVLYKIKPIRFVECVDMRDEENGILRIIPKFLVWDT